MDENLRKAALDYHRYPRPGKLAIEPTKRMATQRDLALAYSPGVAAACQAIVANPDDAKLYTARGNLVGVISNGTAVLGLGNIGALASKPVMEGKAVLFKKFAGIDVFDIEVDASDPTRFCDVVAALEPTFGAINLEDIKAPECFAIEADLRARMKIPVFHDDQHGTAITVAAAVTNGLVLQGKTLADIKVVTSGAGAAALACIDLLVTMGLKVENVFLTDIEGVVHRGRNNMGPNLARYAKDTEARTLEEVLDGADLFLGLSAPRVLKREWLAKLAPRPVIMALANPEPEILPEIVREDRPDAIIATGRSDYPNQVNNVLCFPFIFRGALDCGATTINEEMKQAAVEALAGLARIEASETVVAAYGGAAPIFGADYIIPKPFDPRLILEIAPAVARAAHASGVAHTPIEDFVQYRRELERFTYRSGQLMRPVVAAAQQSLRTIAYGAGEDERVLRAVQTVVDDGIARPILIGARETIERKVREMGLRLDLNQAVTILDPTQDTETFAPLLAKYKTLAGRRGVRPDAADVLVRNQSTVCASLLVSEGIADAALCGGYGDWWRHLQFALPIIPRRPGASRVYAMTAVILQEGPLFFCDTHMNVDPTSEQVAEMTELAAEAVSSFGITPKVALLSHSSFGSSNSETARKMRRALPLIRERLPNLEVDGEMQADAALAEATRARAIQGSSLSGTANLLIMPTLDSANIAFNLIKASGDGLQVGPLLLGLTKPVHILVPTATARAIINISAIAAAEANSRR
ncbi:MAG TPA: NADP-dependent malic enzyme [Acidisoma sp.]|nr:NADP-dependent malic enzyme [Acidisoma sp.]HTI02749.1 NADP-dependent malic enzyme [Acidisoma sp.]